MGDRIKSKPTQRVKMLKYKESQSDERSERIKKAKLDGFEFRDLIRARLELETSSMAVGGRVNEQ